MGDLQNEYVDLIEIIAQRGLPVECRGEKTYEVTNATLVFPDVTAPLLPVRVGRKINLKLAAVETLDMIAGTCHADLVRRAAPEYGDVLVNPADLDYGAYGPRLTDQLQRCVTTLRVDPTTRQAVATVWRSDDLTHDGDRPCTIFMQFLIREGELQLHVTMRSNDVWLGTPYDIFAFTQIQRTVAYALDVPAGPYVHHATSLHLYARNLDQAENLSYTTSNSQSLARAVLPHGVRPPTEVEEPTGRHNFTMLQNSAFMLLAGALFSSNETPLELPMLDGARWENQWYANQLEKLIAPKEVS